MPDNILPEDYYYEQEYEQEQLEQWESLHEEALRNCNHHMTLNAVDERWLNGSSARWFALWECKECNLFDEHVISCDDYLYWKNKGY